MGFYATDTILTGPITTTGTPMIEVLPDGTINNNALSPDISRAMAFYEKLNRDGVMNGRELNDWFSPELFAQNCDKLLFLGMEPELTYITTPGNAGIRSEIPSGNAVFVIT